MSVRIITGDVRDVLPTLPTDSFDCAVTSPPYFGLRDYGCAGQIGLEPTLDAYLAEMVAVCREVRRLLKSSGTFWLNIGDSYATSGGTGKQGATGQRASRTYTAEGSSKKGVPAGLKSKDLMMVPARLALALQADGWWLRSEIIWAKPNPMPESVADRPTSAHEKIWLLTKSERYYFDALAIREAAITYKRQGTCNVLSPKTRALQDSGHHGLGGDLGVNYEREHRNIRNVWTMATQPFAEAHFATFPPELAERCIKAGCSVGGHVLDPFGGAGTTGLVADRLQRSATLIELNPAYAEMAQRRIDNDAGMFSECL